MSEEIKTPLEPQLYTAKIRESDKLVTGFLVDHKSWPRSVIIEVFDIKDKRHPMTLHYVDRNSVREEMNMTKCDCSAPDRASKAWEQWFAEQVDGGDEWTSLERILAKDAWMSALRWSGYFEMQDSMKP